MAKRRTSGKQEKQAKHQITAIILLALAILFFLLMLIEKEHFWRGLHLLLRGVFGLTGFLIPPLMGYISVSLSREKGTGRMWSLITLYIALSLAAYIFTFSAELDIGYFTALKTAYEQGAEGKLSGLFGAMLGYPMIYLFTDTGAKIIISLLIFVLIMLITRTTVAALFKALLKPVKATQKTLQKVKEQGIPQPKKRVKIIDIDLDDDRPAQPEPPAQEEQADVPFAVAEEQPKPIEALENLKKAAKQLKETASSDVSDALSQALEKEEPGGYRYPPISLLDQPKNTDADKAEQEQAAIAALLVKTLNDYGISTRVVHISRGPSVTRYELEPSAGIKLSRITGLADDIAMRLATTGVRIEAPIPNKAAVGIEVPNKVKSMVCLRELIDSPEFLGAKSKLTVALGRDIAGKIVLADLSKMPHLLIAGTTGSGKSVCTNAMIQSILYKASPSEVRLLLIDPKQVEFSVYNGIPHLLVPVVTDPRKAAGALGWAVNEMLGRYKTFAENNVRDLTAYNNLAKRTGTLQPMPQILIVIDELADLMMVAPSEVEDAIIRLAQMARAAGMHLVIATQRPSVDVITGLIKANIPSRLALTVASAVDSRTIIDSGGAEKLLGKGDMLFMPVGFTKPMRVQGCFVSDREVERVVEFLKSTEQSDYDEEVIQEIDRQAAASGKGAKDDEDLEGTDELFPQAVEVVIEAGMASTSLLQRRLKLGYARAGRIIDEMEQRGIVGPHEGSKPRKVLITRQQWLEMNAMQE